MREKLILALACNAVAALCIGAAVCLMLKRMDGWGWLLFIAVLFGQVPKKDGQDKPAAEESK